VLASLDQPGDGSEPSAAGSQRVGDRRIGSAVQQAEQGRLVHGDTSRPAAA
jgi:hypothetical protein